MFCKVSVMMFINLLEIPRNKSNDKSFSRSWSKNETPNDKAYTSNAVPFERGKYKSDGQSQSI